MESVTGRLVNADETCSRGVELTIDWSKTLGHAWFPATGPVPSEDRYSLVTPTGRTIDLFVYGCESGRAQAWVLGDCGD